MDTSDVDGTGGVNTSKGIDSHAIKHRTNDVIGIWRSVTMGDEASKWKCLKHAPELRNNSKFRNVYISPDLT